MLSYCFYLTMFVFFPWTMERNYTKGCNSPPCDCLRLKSDGEKNIKKEIVPGPAPPVILTIFADKV